MSDQPSNSIFKSNKAELFFAAVLLLLVCLGTYGDLLTHQFMDDDHVYIKSAASIFSFYRNFGDFFIKAFDQHYAPLHYLINVELFKLFQEPLPLYLINLVFFYINCLLIFIFIYFISNEFIVALLTSVIFVIHPMTGEVLQHITRSSILVQNILLELGLISLYLYAKHHRNIFYYFFIAINSYYNHIA